MSQCVIVTVKANHIKTRHHSTLGFIVVMAVVVFGGGVGLLSQRQEELLLRAERDVGHFEMRELQRLRAENTRLRESEIPAAELEVLRSDHAALPRLRAELDALTLRSSVPVP